MVDVPCGTCRLCCMRQRVNLVPGVDDPTQYQTHKFTTREGVVVDSLNHKENGDCVYLDETGCTIHDRAPRVCKDFDCRVAYLRLNHATRRRLVAQGRASKAVFDAGKARLKD